MSSTIKRLLKKIKKLEEKVAVIPSINSADKNVKIDIDTSDESNLSSYKKESGSDTVYGQGTNPNPQDETYLNLLKKASVKPTKVIIKP